jgi:hypothetical protein
MMGESTELHIPTPWWVRIFVQVGFPTALAVLLVAALLGWMPSPIMQTLSRLEYNAWQQTSILRSICYKLDGNQYRSGCEPMKLIEDR